MHSLPQAERPTLSESKKEREDHILFVANTKNGKISVTHDSVTGEFTFPEAEPGSLRVEKSYERKSGKPKILSSINSDGGNAYFDIDRMIKNTFSHMVSIDTNSRELNGTKISICTSYYVPGLISDHNEGIPFEHLSTYLIKNPKKDINPERIGWSLILKHNLKFPLDFPQQRMAIIVDSEKGSLEIYNSRKLPFIGSHFLPHQAIFSYASDKDKDSLPGKMIKMCHNVANAFFREMEEKGISIPELNNGNEFHDGYCQLAPKNA